MPATSASSMRRRPLASAQQAAQGSTKALPALRAGAGREPPAWLRVAELAERGAHSGAALREPPPPSPRSLQGPCRGIPLGPPRSMQSFKAGAPRKPCRGPLAPRFKQGWAGGVGL